MLVWNRSDYSIIQELPCIGIDGSENKAMWAKATQAGALAWQEDGSLVCYSMQSNGILRRRKVLNGHIQGCPDGASIEGTNLLTASPDSKVNLWDYESGKLLWSNSRSDARYRRSALSSARAVVAGSYDQEGYLQVYYRLSGEALSEMLTMEGGGFQGVEAGEKRIVALLSIKHKLLTCKVIVGAAA